MATQISTARLNLTRRPRRLRRTEAIRSLVRETKLTPDHEKHTVDVTINFKPGPPAATGPQSSP